MRGAKPAPPLATVLYASVLAIAVCGLVYELCAGALATYLLGNSITQFSLVIGAYLSAMGVGSFLSRYLERDLLARFVEIEIAVALIGGFEAPILFALFAYSPAFRLLLYAFVALVGVGVGLELPLLIRILERSHALKDLVARVMFLDYVGALIASVLFPMVLVPRLGLLRTTLVFGLVNALVALASTVVFDDGSPARTRLRVLAGAAIAALAAGLAGAGWWERRIEQDLFADPVVLRAVSPYQHLTITSREGDTRLFIDGQLQFSTIDEYRYHESLVHPAMASASAARRVLVLGGGDGLAVREILKWPEVERIVLVDLDPLMTELFTDRSELAALNHRSLSDPRVEVVNADAFLWLQGAPALDRTFDVAIVDFPDPNDYGLGKLYTTRFYRLLAGHLAPGAAISVQATSPMWSPEAFSCIAATIAAAGLEARPYHVYVPAFGEWGFVLAGVGALPIPRRPLPDDLRFLDPAGLDGLFMFPKDLAPRPAPENRLDNQVLVRLYEQDWRKLQGYR
ncbi:MAG: polyamine aminopropyltransferase [Myxococcota bacterium]